MIHTIVQKHGFNHDLGNSHDLVNSHKTGFAVNWNDVSVFSAYISAVVTSKTFTIQTVQSEMKGIFCNDTHRKADTGRDKYDMLHNQRAYSRVTHKQHVNTTGF